MNHQLPLICQHLFEYPSDLGMNYNGDGETLRGVCKYCGAIQDRKGSRWSERVMEKYIIMTPLREWNDNFDLGQLLGD